MHRRYKLALLLLLIPCVAHGAGSVGSLGTHSSRSNSANMRFRQYPLYQADNIYDKRDFIITCTQTATLSRNSVCQIYNPVGSGKYVMLDLLRCWHSSGTAVDLLVPQNTARTTLMGGATNLYLGSANTPVAQVYADTISSLAPTSSAVDQINISATIATNANLAQGFPGLPPGAGVELEALTQNIGLNCEF